MYLEMPVIKIILVMKIRGKYAPFYVMWTNTVFSPHILVIASRKVLLRGDRHGKLIRAEMFLKL
jgi:hypothetical protein